MRSVVQRVRSASVTIDNVRVSEIATGVLVLLGVEHGDLERDADVLAHKLAHLRMFAGSRPMDRSLLETGGQALVVSQFTLAGSVRKGRRPSFDRAELPARAEPLYERVCEALSSAGVYVARGVFGANMQVELVNDGPVTLLVEVRGGKIV